MRTVLALATATVLLAWSGPALPQDEAADPPETRDVYAELAAEIARMKAEIAGIERLMRWQADLTRMARTDREEALRQRLPMSDCLASALAPICDELTGLFRPEVADESPAMPAIEGEGAP